MMQKQLYYIQHKNLGYDRDHVLILPMSNSMFAHLDLIKQEFKQNPDVLSISRCHRSPVEGGGGYNMRSEIMPENQQIAVTANPADEDFIKTTGLQLIAGESFNSQDVISADDTNRKTRLYHFCFKCLKTIGMDTAAGNWQKNVFRR